jgi:competence protein ComEC
MLRLASASVGIAWALQFADTRPLLALPATAWTGLALLAWCLRGGPAAIVVLAGGWTLVRADWVLERHLPEMLAGRDVMVSGTICDFPRTDREATRLVLVVESSSADPTGHPSELARPLTGNGLLPGPERVHLSWYDDAPALRPGERWQLRVRLRTPRGLRNPGGFDFEQWLFVRGIGATGYVRRSPLNVRLPARGDCAIGALRSRLAARVETALGAHPAAGHVLGVAVGATHRLGEADWELLRRTGTTHLLAISGLNIAMIAAPFLLVGPLLGRLWRRAAGRPHLGVVPALVAAAGYSALSGFAISTVRALAMLCLGAAVALRGRRAQGVELLGAAGLAVVVLDPPAVMSLSFWLSFVAVAWLFVATVAPEKDTVGAPAARAWHGTRRAGLELARAQLVLGLGLAPLTLAVFHELSLVAPLTNLLAVPVFSLVVMPLTLLGAALVVPAPALGGLLLGLAADVVALLLTFLRVMAEMPLATWAPPRASAAGLAMGLAGAALLCWWRPVPARPLALLWLLPLLAGTRVARPELEVTVMDVGQGLAVLVRTARHALLYDAGPAFGMRDAGESVVLPVVHAAGVRALNALVISHDDQDHRGGATTVLAAHPGALLIAPVGGGLAARRFAPCRAGLEWTWDGVHFRVLSPDASGWDSDNDGSCVLRVESAHASLLLTGDIERARERRLAGALEPAGLVLAPHHGSRSSSSEELVAALGPAFVVFSAGHANRWGFPASEVVQRWRARGACLLDTAGAGALVLTAGEGGWRVTRRERVDGAHLWTTVGRVHECASSGG